MKRWFVLFALLLVGAAPFRLRSALEKAVQNERDAVARYEACAAKAVEEGYPGAASLFRAAAQAESIHAARFAALLTERGLSVPDAVESHPAIGSTADNLRAASSAETSERDTIYREALNAAHEARDTAAAEAFDQTRDTEVEHANLFSGAARQLEQFKTPRHYYVCEKCGYTTDVELPLCALCRLNKHPHEVE